jgi:hypothetical protein
MIVLRGSQGFFGGVLIPMTFTIIVWRHHKGTGHSDGAWGLLCPFTRNFGGIRCFGGAA